MTVEIEKGEGKIARVRLLQQKDTKYVCMYVCMCMYMYIGR
jgi:hypothetical protein